MSHYSKPGLALAVGWAGLFAVIASGGGHNLYAIALFGFPWVFINLGALDLLGLPHYGLFVFVVPCALDALIIYWAVASLQRKRWHRFRHGA